MKQWWRQRTLRFRLAMWYAIGGVVLLTAFSATIYFFVAYRVARPLDHQLQRDLETIRHSLRIDASGAIIWEGQLLEAGSVWPSARPWFELWDEHGRLVRRFWPFSEDQLERVPVAPAPSRETLSVFSVSPDVRLRVLSVPLPIESRSAQWMLRVMVIHEPAVGALPALLLILGIALPVVVILLVLGGYAITRRWLKPLDRMVAEADRITAHDLSRRLPVVNPFDELGRLAHVFNTTLARLENSFLTLDRFVADAAHELLTPLTTLRSVGEVCLRSARTPDEYRETIGSMLEEALRLQLLVEKLLQLARAEGESKMVERARVQIDELVRQCVDDATVLADDKDQQLVLKSTGASIETDPLLLRQALQNLLDNAIKYSPRGACITIAVREAAGMCEIAVTDTGPGIPLEFRARLSERFFRVDNSRERRSGGFGLGLAITKAYLGVLGGALEYDPVEPHGSTFRIRLPLPEPTSSLLS